MKIIKLNNNLNRPVMDGLKAFRIYSGQVMIYSRIVNAVFQDGGWYCLTS